MLTRAKLHRFFNKLTSAFLIFQLAFFQLISLVLPTAIQAVGVNSFELGFNSSTNEVTITLNNSEPELIEYRVFYYHDQLEALEGAINAGEFTATKYLGTCSEGEECIPHSPEKIVAKVGFSEVKVKKYTESMESYQLIDDYAGTNLSLSTDEEAWLTEGHGLVGETTATLETPFVQEVKSDDGKLVVGDTDSDGTTITLARYESADDLPGGANAVATPLGIYYEVSATPEPNWPMSIELAYTQSDLDAAGLTEEELTGLYYYSQTTGEWRLYSDSGTDDPGACISTTGVDTADIDEDFVGKIYASVCHLTPMGGGAGSAPAASPDEVWVDDDWTGPDGTVVDTGKTIGHNAFDQIQEGVDAVNADGTVHVYDGLYQEQVVINKNLDVIGYETPVVLASDAVDSFVFPGSSKTWEPIILAFGGSNTGGNISGSETITVNLSGFEIDGNDRTPGSGRRSSGVIYRNAAGQIEENSIYSMQVGNAETFGIMVYGDSNVEILNNHVSDYSRGGIGVNGDNGVEPDPVGLVEGNIVEGPGADTAVVWAPNGIQLGYGTTGTINNNTVTGNGWPGSAWSGTAIMVVDTAHVAVTNNTVENNEQALSVVDFPESLYGSVWSGIVSDITVTGNTVNNNQWGLAIANEVSGVTVSKNTFSNIDYDAIDVYAYASGVTPPTGIDIHSNALETSIGADGLWVGGDVTELVKATKNWWGDATGPGGDGPGLGATLVGNASFCPWLVNDDLDSHSYAGDCLAQISGRTFMDLADNGLRLSADGDHPDGRQDGFSVRLYDDVWSLMEEQETSTTGQVGQFKFTGLLAESTIYYVCGVDELGYSHSPASIGQTVVKPDGNSATPGNAEAVIIANGSGVSDESPVCWQVTLDDNDGGYINTGYVSFDAPTLTSPADNAYLTGNPTQNWSAVDGVDHYIYESSLDSGFSTVAYTTIVNGISRTVGGMQTTTFWWRVKAVDADGSESIWSDAWKLNVDNTDPVVTLSQPLDSDLVKDTVDIRGTIDEVLELSHYNISIYPGGSDFNDSSQRIYSNTVYQGNGFSDQSLYVWDTTDGSYPDGEYLIRLAARDKAQNRDLSGDPYAGGDDSQHVISVTVDNTVPDLTIDSIQYLNGTVESGKFVTNYNTPVILGTTSTDVASLNLTVNGHSYPATLSSTDWEVSVTDVIPDGVYTMSVEAVDHAGNSTVETQDIAIDTVAPTAVYQQFDGTTEVTGTVAYVNDLARLSFTGEYTDADPSVGLYWDSYVIFEAQDDGSFGFGRNGKQSFCSWRSTPNLVDISGGSTYSLTTNEAFTNCEPSLTDGEYYMTHHVYDEATRGDIPSINQFRDVLGLHFIIDTVKPSSEITTPTNTGDNSVVYNNTWDGSITGTASDDQLLAGVEISIKRASDDAYWTGADWSGVDENTRVKVTGTDTWSYDLTSPAEDVYTIISHAVDQAGNVEDSYQLTVVFDKTIPEIDLTIDPTNPDGSNGWYKTQPTITLTATDNNDPNHGFAQLEYQWNSQTGTWTTSSNQSVSFNPPSEGQHILYYRALDKADNYSEVGIKNVLYDSEGLEEGPLNVSVSPNPTSGTTATVSWDEASDGITIDKYEVIWQLDGTSTQYSKTVNSTTFETEIDQLTEGEWSIKVKAFDGVGNSKEAGVRLVVDQTAPAAPTLALDTTGPGTASLSWNAVDGAEEYLVFYGTTSGDYIYGANVGGVTSYTVQGLGAGNYFFIVRAKDAAHNQSGNSNEVGTGAIAGAPGVEPGEPAEGFIPAGEVQGATTDEVELENLPLEGEVLGTSEALPWLKYNLPWILLLIQGLVILIVDHLTRHKQSIIKHLIALVTTALVLGAFAWLVNPEVYSQGTLLSFLANIFTWISIGLMLLLRGLNFAFIEEVAN